MSITTEEYVKRAEECERLAGACISESNREILLYAAAHWRMLAEADACALPAPPVKAMQGSGGLDDMGSGKGARDVAVDE
jgi:hypothetical protein